jgi:hypothetical protein
MTPVGSKKHARKWATREDEPIDAVALVVPGGNYGGLMAKTYKAQNFGGEPPPMGTRTLVVTSSDQLRLFEPSLRDPFHREEFSRPCGEIIRIQRRRGVFGIRIRITFSDGERLEFHAPRGLSHSGAVVDLIATKASVMIDPGMA